MRLVPYAQIIVPSEQLDFRCAQLVFRRAQFIIPLSKAGDSVLKSFGLAFKTLPGSGANSG